MYLSFFGLNEKPFAITPDPRYLYLSERHAEALAHLVYGINEAGGFVQLTGEVGTGKTTVVRSLLTETPRNAEIALILNPRMTAPEFLLTICEELGIGVPDSATGSLKDLVDILSGYLLRAHGQGKRIVLVVDEAQNLAPDVLEQVRLLTNLETNTQKLLQIILIGQPELRDLLARTELRQLAQRVTGRYHLCPLLRQETSAYVLHRLRVAGATSDIFTARALAEVHRLSGGVPRVINILCDRALLGAYTQDRHRVTPAILRRSAVEVFGRRLLPRWLPWGASAATAVVLALAALALWQLEAGHILGRSVPGTAHGTSAAGGNTRAAGGVSHAARAGPLGGARAGSSVDASAAVLARDPDGAAPPGPPSSAAIAVAPPGSNAVSLTKLLTEHASETDLDSAFGALFSLWGAHYVAGSVDPCTQALQQGLQCFTQRGSLAELRLYNRPAILTLTDASGAPHQVVLSGLGDELARIELDGAHAVRIADLSRYWYGEFVLLWRPRSQPVKPLSLGMRGDGVQRLRERLEHIEGMKSSAPPSDLFDAELGRLVRVFQRSHRLTVDGIAGVQTLVVLNGATAAPHTPVLTSPMAHGS